MGSGLEVDVVAHDIQARGQGARKGARKGLAKKIVDGTDANAHSAEESCLNFDRGLKQGF